MLLNEFRKQHDRVEQQAKTIVMHERRSEEQGKTIAEQKQEIEALKARLSRVEELTARLDALDKVVSNK